MLPHFLQDKVPAMLGCESGLLSPSQEEPEEQDLSSGMKKRNRRSFGGKSPDHSFVLVLQPKQSTATGTLLQISHAGKQVPELELKQNSLNPFGLSRISDVVSGALNKMKTNRTPTNAPQADGLGRYRG